LREYLRKEMGQDLIKENNLLKKEIENLKNELKFSENNVKDVRLGLNDDTIKLSIKMLYLYCY
jgi:hypothetical protein